jgi:hypothetical protein
MSSLFAVGSFMRQNDICKCSLAKIMVSGGGRYDTGAVRCVVRYWNNNALCLCIKNLHRQSVMPNLWHSVQPQFEPLETCNNFALIFKQHFSSFSALPDCISNSQLYVDTQIYCFYVVQSLCDHHWAQLIHCVSCYSVHFCSCCHKG